MAGSPAIRVNPATADRLRDVAFRLTGVFSRRVTLDDALNAVLAVAEANPDAVNKACRTGEDK